MAKLTDFVVADGAKRFEATPDKDTITPRRKRIAASIDKLIAAAKAGEDKARGKVYEVRDGIAKAHIRQGSRNLVLEGQEYFYVAKEKLAAFYEEVKSQILAGDHDDALKALDEPEKPAGRTPRAPREGKREGNFGWSDERKARFKATIAAKQAAKAQGK
jgi:hypothetical protein